MVCTQLQADVCLAACSSPMARDRRLLEAQLGSLLTLVATTTKMLLTSYNTCIYNDFKIYVFVSFLHQTGVRNLQIKEKGKKVTIEYDVLFHTIYGCLSSQLVSCANTRGNN